MSKVYEIITNQIIAQLETVNPKDWTKPWFNIGHDPINAITGHGYRGINVIMLGGSKYWGSFKQWADKGCTVKKGEKASTCVFWKFNREQDDEGMTTDKIASVMCRYYNVFSIEQVEGEFAANLLANGLKDKLINHDDPYAMARNTVTTYLGNERIKMIEHDVASYSPSEDRIRMPLLGQFKTPEHYYSTYYHGIGHSTGHANRLNRDLTGRFGCTKYAKEELIAELTAAFLCAKTGVSNAPREDHAQYLASWLQGLRNDRGLIVSAASAAQKACDLVLGTQIEQRLAA